MALSLNPGSRGLLLDPFNGIADIEAKVLRILHNYAFLEEPIRLIRATRLAARFHCTLEERTQARYDAAKENNYIEYVGKRSIGHELEQLAHEDDPLLSCARWSAKAGCRVLHPHWTAAKIEASELGHVIKQRQMMNELGYLPETGPINMYFLTKRMSREGRRRDTADDSAPRLRRQVEASGEPRTRSGEETDRQGSVHAPRARGKFCRSAPPEDVLFLSVTTKQQAVDAKLKNFFTKWRQVREKLPFPEMAELRITAQLPEYPKILDEAFLLLLDGKLRSHNEIINFLKPYEPPPPPPPPPARRGRGKAAAAAAPAAPGAPAPAPAGKRGRKPKGAPEAVPAAAPTPAAAPAPAGAKQPTTQPAADQKKPPASAKGAVAAKKAAPAKAAGAVASKPVPIKAAPAKAAPKKEVAKKAAAKKATPAKAAKKAAKAPVKAAKKATPAKKAPSKKARR